MASLHGAGAIESRSALAAEHTFYPLSSKQPTQHTLLTSKHRHRNGTDDADAERKGAGGREMMPTIDQGRTPVPCQFSANVNFA